MGWEELKKSIPAWNVWKKTFQNFSVCCSKANGHWPFHVMGSATLLVFLANLAFQSPSHAFTKILTAKKWNFKGQVNGEGRGEQKREVKLWQKEITNLHTWTLFFSNGDTLLSCDALQSSIEKIRQKTYIKLIHGSKLIKHWDEKAPKHLPEFWLRIILTVRTRNYKHNADTHVYPVHTHIHTPTPARTHIRIHTHRDNCTDVCFRSAQTWRSSHCSSEFHNWSRSLCSMLSLLIAKNRKPHAKPQHWPASKFHAHSYNSQVVQESCHSKVSAPPWLQLRWAADGLPVAPCKTLIENSTGCKLWGHPVKKTWSKQAINTGLIWLAWTVTEHKAWTVTERKFWREPSLSASSGVNRHWAQVLAPCPKPVQSVGRGPDSVNSFNKQLVSKTITIAIKKQGLRKSWEKKTQRLESYRLFIHSSHQNLRHFLQRKQSPDKKKSQQCPFLGPCFFCCCCLFVDYSKVNDLL